MGLDSKPLDTKAAVGKVKISIGLFMTAENTDEKSKETIEHCYYFERSFFLHQFQDS